MVSLWWVRRVGIGVAPPYGRGGSVRGPSRFDLCGGGPRPTPGDGVCDGERDGVWGDGHGCVCAVCACAVAGAFAHPSFSLFGVCGVMELVPLIALLCGESGKLVGSFVDHPALPFNGVPPGSEFLLQVAASLSRRIALKWTASRLPSNYTCSNSHRRRPMG